jgi:hypothetical protein
MYKKTLILAWFLFLFPGLIAYAGGLAPTGSGASSSSVSGSVSITGTPTVSITGTPTVSMTGTPTVSITGTPTVNLNNTSIPMTYWELGAPTTSVNTNIGSNTATTLQSLASFTAHTLVTIQCNSKIHFDKVGTATGTMQSSDFINNYDRVVWRVGTTAFDLALIGDTVGGNASVALKIYPLY